MHTRGYMHLFCGLFDLSVTSKHLFRSRLATKFLTIGDLDGFGHSEGVAVFPSGSLDEVGTVSALGCRGVFQQRPHVAGFQCVLHMHPIVHLKEDRKKMLQMDKECCRILFQFRLNFPSHNFFQSLTSSKRMVQSIPAPFISSSFPPGWNFKYGVML